MGFLELLVIGVVGLVVVGPDRLPGALKSGMVWFGRIKRAVNSTKAELEKQIGMDEIRREIHNAQVMESLKALKQARDDAENESKKFVAMTDDAADDQPKQESKEDIAARQRAYEQERGESAYGRDHGPALEPDHYREDEGLYGEQHGNHQPAPSTAEQTQPASPAEEHTSKPQS